jgi:hypothetical protein
MTASGDAGEGSATVETGYEWLSERAARSIAQLTSIEIAADADILADDQFFHPIYRTLSQDVAQCLLSALDHVRFLVWSLKNRDQPYPVAQATLIRTAITGAATALWMVSAPTPVERRCRAMEFMFSDIKSQLAWMNTAAAEPMHQQHPATEWAAFEAQRTELKRRQDWIVQQANAFLVPVNLYTCRTYGQRITSDSDMVRSAGAITPALGTGGWNSELVLLNSWQVLSGYAHAGPWALPLGSTLAVTDSEPNPTTGAIKVTAEGNSDRLLDTAFRAILVIENGVGWLNALST